MTKEALLEALAKCLTEDYSACASCPYDNYSLGCSSKLLSDISEYLNQWTSEYFPKDPGMYIVTLREDLSPYTKDLAPFTTIAVWVNNSFITRDFKDITRLVTAWMPVPKPATSTEPIFFKKSQCPNPPNDYPYNF